MLAMNDGGAHPAGRTGDLLLPAPASLGQLMSG